MMKHGKDEYEYMIWHIVTWISIGFGAGRSYPQAWTKS